MLATRKFLNLMALIWLTFQLSVENADAQNFWENDAPHHTLRCLSGESRDLVREVGHSENGETYFVDEFDPEVIRFVEGMLFKKPYVLSKIDFAKSCIIVDAAKLTGIGKLSDFDEPELLCRAIRLLENQGAIQRSDIYQLEELSLSGGASYFAFDQRSLRKAIECLFER